MRVTEAIKHLLIINGIMFAVAALNLIPNFTELTAIWYFQNPNFHWWQVISHMFMHGGLMHLVFNMYALWAFGSPLEQMWGSKKFLFFYFSCGIGAMLLHTGVNYYYFHKGYEMLVAQGVSGEQIMQVLAEGKYNTQWQEMIPQGTFDNMMSAFFTPAVGASGAIYGILVAFGMMFPNAELMLIFLPIPVKAKYFIPALVLIDLFSGVTGFSIFGGGIAHFAHVGGALIGFIMMWYWKRNSFNDHRWN